MKLVFRGITPHQITHTVNFSQVETANKCSWNVLKTMPGTKHLKILAILFVNTLSTVTIIFTLKM